MKPLKGPAVFLAQFIADEKPFNTIDPMAQWAANLGFKGFKCPLATRTSSMWPLRQKARLIVMS